MIILRKVTLKEVDLKQVAKCGQDCKCSADNYVKCMCMREDGC